MTPADAPSRLTDRAGLPLTGGSLALNFRAVSLLEGIRAAIAVAGTLAAGALLDQPQLALAALGALLACFTDPGGALPARLPPMLIFGVAGAICLGGFGLLDGASPLLAIPVAGLAIFCCSLARIYGQGGLLTGNLLAVTIVLALDMPTGSPVAALHAAFGFWAGAAEAAILTLALWRIRPFGPARAALADAALALAELARDLAEREADAGGETGFDLHARGHRRAVREAIERARAVTQATLRRRGVASQRANALVLRLATFDQLFGALIALGEEMAARGADDPAARRALAGIGDLLGAMAPELEAGRTLDTAPLRAGLEALRGTVSSAKGDPALRRPLAAALDRLSVLITVSNAPGVTAADEIVPPDLMATILGPLRSNLSLASVPLRHALRSMLVAIPALAFVAWLGNPFGHWLAITVILVLQPHFSATWIRAIERVGGTAAGGLVAAAIGLLVHTRLELAVAMVPLTLFAFAVRGVNYSAWVVLLTPMIVLLIEQIDPGANQWVVAASRVGFTLAGGILAVAANLVLWPSFEGNRLGAARRDAIAAHRAYLVAAFAHLTADAPPPEAARRQAGLASNNLEASIARVMMEPHRDDDKLLRAAIVTDAALRRTAGRLAALALEPRPEAAARAGCRAWAEALAAWFDPDLPAPPPLPPPVGLPAIDDGLARLARQAELVREPVTSETIA